MGRPPFIPSLFSHQLTLYCPLNVDIRKCTLKFSRKMKLFVFLWSVVSLTTVEVSGFTLQVSPPTSFLLHGTGDAPSGAPGDTVRDVSANSEPSNDTPQKKKIVIKKREKKGTEMISERKVLTDVEFYKQQEEEKAAAAAAEGGTGGADVAAVVKPMDTVQFSILSTFRANAGVSSVRSVRSVRSVSSVQFSSASSVQFSQRLSFLMASARKLTHFYRFYLYGRLL